MKPSHGKTTLSRRDNFTPAVKDKLARRAGFLCSYPNCMRITSGPAAGSADGTVNMGKAAHITAAAAGGPRYDETLSVEERKSIDNGAWMCAHHADLIDNDESRYPAELLRRWKEDHEARVAELLKGTGPGLSWRSAADLVRHNLPYPRNPEFVGRQEELDRLHTLLSPETPVVVSQAPSSLTGLGGVGKTQLALEYCYRHLLDYRAILWVDADGEDITANVAALAKTLGLGLPPDVPAAEQAAAVREALSQSGPYLLVLDNVDHPESYPAHVPRTGNTRVLVTTRRHDLAGVDAFEVDVLPPGAALRLLLGNEDWPAEERESACALCEELGCLTLAVAVAGRILRKRVRTPSSLLALVRRTGGVACSSGGPPDALFGKHPSLAALFDASLALLDESDEPVRTLSRSMALVSGWFAPAPIARELLFDATRRLDPASAEHDDVTESPELALERLVDLGLARLDAQANPVVHRLVQRWLRLQDCGAARAAADAEIVSLATRSSPDTVEILRLARHRPHLLSAVERLGTNPSVDEQLLALRLCQICFWQGEYAESLRQCDRLLQRLGDVVRRHEILCVRSDALLSMGRSREALAGFVEALDIVLHSYAADISTTATVMLHIGQSLNRLEDSLHATEFLRHALTLQESSLGPSHWLTAVTLTALAQVALRSGDYAQANVLSMRASRIHDEALGPDHPESIVSRLVLGESIHRLGRPEQALEHYERAQTGAIRSFGPEHPTTLSVRSSTAQALLDAGRVDEALALFDALLPLQEKTHGNEHPSVGATLHSLGQALQAAGRPEEALRVYSRALAVDAKNDGLGSFEAAVTLNSIGQALRHLERHEEALDYLEKAILNKLERVGEAHPSTAATRGEIARVLLAQRKPVDALQSCLSALSAAESTAGEGHPYRPMLLRIIAAALVAQERFDEAAAALESALTIHGAQTAPDNMDAAATLIELARLSRRRGQMKRAIHYYESAVNIARDQLGEKHAVTSRFAQEMAETRREGASSDNADPR